MRSLRLRNLVAVSALGLAMVLGASVSTNAQGNRNHDWNDKKNAKQAEKVRREQARAEAMRARIEQQRQAEWARRNAQIARTRTTRTIGGGFYNVPMNGPVTQGRYRIYRNGRYYNTTNQGVDMLRQAINEGYRQGFAAGRNDFNGRRNTSWANNNIYRSGTYGYSNGVERSQYQYYFQQGFQRGYQDGSNSQYQNGYNGSYQYGTNDGGTLNILGSILGTILNIQTY